MLYLSRVFGIILCLSVWLNQGFTFFWISTLMKFYYWYSDIIKMFDNHGHGIYGIRLKDLCFFCFILTDVHDQLPKRMKPHERKWLMMNMTTGNWLMLKSLIVDEVNYQSIVNYYGSILHPETLIYGSAQYSQPMYILTTNDLDCFQLHFSKWYMLSFVTIAVSCNCKEFTCGSNVNSYMAS